MNDSSRTPRAPRRVAGAPRRPVTSPPRSRNVGRRRIWALAILVVLLVVIAAGAWFLFLRPQPGDVVVEAYEASAQEGRADITIRGDVDDAGDVEFTGVQIEGRGTLDLDTGTSAVTFQLMDVLNAGGSLGALQKVAAIYAGDDLYLTFRQLSRVVGEKNRWLRLTAADLQADAGTDVGVLRHMFQMDPAFVWRFAAAAPDDIQELGREEIDGESTTRYSYIASIDTLREDAQGEHADLYELLEASGIESVVVELWVAGDRAVRISTSYPIPIAPGVEDTTDFTVTMDLSPAPTAPAIETPAEAAVIELGDIL